MALADTVFVANHCFHNGGLERIAGHDYLRVDFVAASAIKDPDVDGSIFLDPVSFQIRRSFLHLSKPPRAVPDLLETEATTIFSELFPSVSVIASVSSVNHLRPDTRRREPPTQTREEQVLIGVQFTGRRPGEDLKKPR